MKIKPFKIKYYLERKDPDFENKMHDVLLVYKQVEMQFDANGDITIPDSGHLTHTISHDENPAFRLFPTNILTITQRRKTVMSVGIMSIRGLERCHCLQALTF